MTPERLEMIAARDRDDECPALSSRPLGITPVLDAWQDRRLLLAEVRRCWAALYPHHYSDILGACRYCRAVWEDGDGGRYCAERHRKATGGGDGR